MRSDLFDRKLPPRMAVLAMAACGFLWSTGGALIKLCTWDSITISFGRSAVACLSLLLFLRMIGKRVVVNRTILLAASMVCVKYICFITANKLTASANVIAIQYTSPIFVLFFSALFLKQRPRRKDVVISAVTVLGVALLVIDGLRAGGMAGNVLALTSGIMTAGMYLVMGRMATYEETLSVTVAGHGMVALVTLPLVLWSAPVFSLNNLAAVLALGLVQQAVAYGLYGLAIRSASAVSCSIIACVDPLLNPVWAALLVHEIPGPLAVAGFVIVLGAITLWSVTDARAQNKIAR